MDTLKFQIGKTYLVAKATGSSSIPSKMIFKGVSTERRPNGYSRVTFTNIDGTMSITESFQNFKECFKFDKIKRWKDEGFQEMYSIDINNKIYAEDIDESLS